MRPQTRALLTPALAPPEPSRPRVSWQPAPKIPPCLRCGRPRLSSSASDRLHPKCRPAGELNDGEAAGLVL
jgi:hypothetical protein